MEIKFFKSEDRANNNGKSITTKIKKLKKERVKSERVALTSIKDMNLVGLTVIFTITTKNIDMSTTINGVTSMTPPFPWPISTRIFFSVQRFHLNFFPPHFRDEEENSIPQENKNINFFVFFYFLIWKEKIGCVG